MKTLILYAGKHGAAAEIARRIASKMAEAATHDLARGDAPDLGGFGCVIVGSAIYAGMIRREAKAFAAQNAQALRGKTLGLFLSGMDPSQESTCFAANFPPELLRAAKATAFLGGIFDPKKAGMVGRLIMKAATKQSGYINSIDDNKITRFAEIMQT